MIAAPPPAPAAMIEVRRLPAPEARQGAVGDRRSVYAIDNSAIARYDRTSDRREALWQGDPARFPHLNSCIRHRRHLICAGSNYPAVPMTSMIVWFDARTLQPVRVRDLGGAAGSLTWLDRRGSDWWAGFANYDGKGGQPGRDHRATVVVRFDRNFVSRRTYRLPDAVLERLAPRSTSGGLWGQDGLLRLTGHDRPELYILRLPAGGDLLELVATVKTPTGGQAIGRDEACGDCLWSIDRQRRELVLSRPAR